MWLDTPHNSLDPASLHNVSKIPYIIKIKLIKMSCDVIAPDSVKEPGSGAVESPASSTLFRMLTGRYGAVLQP